MFPQTNKLTYTVEINRRKYDCSAFQNYINTRSCTRNGIWAVLNPADTTYRDGINLAYCKIEFRHPESISDCQKYIETALEDSKRN